MPVRNVNVHRQPRSKTFWAKDCLSVARAVAADNLLTSFSTGNDGMTQVTTSGMAGLLLNTDGRLVRHLIDARETAIDWSKPTLWRVLWTHGSVDVADTILWRLRFSQMSYNSTSVAVATTTALSTIIPQDTVPTAAAFILAATGYGVLNGDTLLPDVSGGRTALSLEITMQTKAVGFAEDSWFMGLQCGYLPRHASDANAYNINADTAAEIGVALGWAAT